MELFLTDEGESLQNRSSMTEGTEGDSEEGEAGIGSVAEVTVLGRPEQREGAALGGWTATRTWWIRLITSRKRTATAPVGHSDDKSNPFARLAGDKLLASQVTATSTTWTDPPVHEQEIHRLRCCQPTTNQGLQCSPLRNA